jgi:hypothetical protein
MNSSDISLGAATSKKKFILSVRGHLIGSNITYNYLIGDMNVCYGKIKKESKLLFISFGILP